MARMLADRQRVERENLPVWAHSHPEACRLVCRLFSVQNGWKPVDSVGWIESAFLAKSIRLSYVEETKERGSNSVVECQLPKLDVAGSTPVSRSIFQQLGPTH